MIAPAALFLFSAAVVAIAGWHLIGATEIIADRLRLGRAFLGMILVASITSLPELATGVSAVTLADAPDIAVGDVVGSCVFNLLLFVLADAASPRVAFYSRLRASHNITAAFSIILMGLLAVAFMAPSTARVAIGHVGVYTPILAVLYLLAARLLYAVDAQFSLAETEAPHVDPGSLRSAVARCLISGLAVVVGGAFLATSADAIAEAAGLSDAFVGVLLVASATSLPEVVTVLAALRIGAHDLVAGNLLGSNLFNMVVLAVDDLAYRKGPLLAAASDVLAVPAVIAVIMTAVVVAALNYVRRTRPGPIDVWAGATLVVLYLFNAALLFGAGR